MSFWIPFLSLVSCRAATTGLEGPSAPPIDDAPVVNESAEANSAGVNASFFFPLIFVALSLGAVALWGIPEFELYVYIV